MSQKHRNSLCKWSSFPLWAGAACLLFTSAIAAHGQGQANDSGSHPNPYKVSASPVASTQDGGGAIVGTAEKGECWWRYTTTKPSSEWMTIGFDDKDWRQGRAGFGSPETPKAVIGTEWRSSDIWLRRAFVLPEGNLGTPALRVHHDEDVEVYLNGQLATRLEGFSTDYQYYPINLEAVATLKQGKNFLAVHCKQTAGGQYIDAGLAWDTGALPPPVLPDFHADPHIAVFGDRFYIYPTTDTPGWNSSSFECWSSGDLNSWQNEGIVLDFPRDLKWAKERAWAPCIIGRNGKYFFYYSAEQSIGVAVGERPEGPFKDPLGKPLIAKDSYQCQVIDPMAFADDDGSC